MSNDLETSVIVNMGGDLQQKAARYEQSIQDFTRKGSRHMNGFRRVVGSVDRSINRMGNRYLALGSGAAAGVAIKGTADLSARLNQLGIDAGFNGDKLLTFKETSKKAIKAAAVEFGVQSEHIIAGIESIVQKTGDIKFATENMENLALAVGATGGEGDDFGGILGRLEQMKVDTPEKVLAILDSLVAQGQQGAFVLKDVASLGERIFSAYSPSNRQQVLEMGAALQVIRKSTGSSEQAVTSFEALMRTLKDTKKVAKLTKAGINIFDKKGFEDYQKGIKPLSEALLPITDIMRNIAEFTKGDEFVVSKLIDESEARRSFAGLLQEFRETGKTSSIDKLLSVSGSGKEIAQDAADNLKEFNAQMIILNESWKTFTDNNLAGPVGEIADQLSNLDTERMQDILETTKNWAIAIGGVVIAYKVARGVMGTVKDFKGAFGKQAGGNALASAAGSLTPIPVYVVNGPGALGAGGRKGKGLKATIGKGVAKTKAIGKGVASTKIINNASKFTQVLSKAKVLGSAAMANPYVRAGTVAFAGGYGIGTLINKQFIQGSEFQIKTLDAITHMLAAMGDKGAQRQLSLNNPQTPLNQNTEHSTVNNTNTVNQPVVPTQPNPSPVSGRLDIEVEVVDSREPIVRVKNIESDGIDLEAGGSMVGY